MTIMSKLKKDIRIYLALKRRETRSQMEDILVLDGFDVATFAFASELWERFQQRPARIVTK